MAIKVVPLGLIYRLVSGYDHFFFVLNFCLDFANSFRSPDPIKKKKKNSKQIVLESETTMGGREDDFLTIVG